ncbi:DUF7344 domain-containing protein [Halomontanus rarus]|uniref:DUF7344 domain-containing protein n=1 Tax=Halomontanus rarus TaxID=3034020 RepID=UPI001A98F155|nr:hypothetical protein [Halovivax sp. TS33]
MRETERKTPTLPVAETPSLDLVFDLLADQRRRYALYYLYESTDGVATVDEIATHVVSLEDQSQVDDPQSHVITALRHVHLPKLEDAGVLEHDTRSQTVRYWSQPSLEEWLEHAQHKEVS